MDCKANPSDPSCKTGGTLGSVKLKMEIYKGGRKCTDPVKCAAYTDGKDSVEVRCIAARRDSKTKTDVPAKDQKLKFSVDLPKDFASENPLALSCTENCITGDDGVTKTVATSTYQSGLELPVKCELQDSKSKASAKSSVRFKEPAPQVTVTVQDGKLVMGRGTADEAVIQATVLLGTTTPPAGAAVQFKVDDIETAKLATTTAGSTLAGSVSVSLDNTGVAMAKLKPIPSTSQNASNVFLRVEVTAAFGTTSATGYTYLVVGNGPAAILSADKAVADADGASTIKLSAGVADKNGARVAGATVRFETDAGIFPNRSKSYEVQTDSTGNASAALVSLQPSSGVAKATVVSTLENCPASGCVSQLLTVTFVGTAISCDVGKISKLDLTYENCPAGPEVTPCRVQNDDDPDTTPVENEVTVLARALDTASKPLSNQVVRFCTCLPHRVETSTRGTIATTDGAGLARITFKAGFKPQTTAVLGYVGCPATDPCADLCSGSGGGGTSSSTETVEFIQKQVPIIVTSSSGYTIEFDQSPILIGVLGTGNDTAELKIAVKDQSGSPVRDGTKVRFYLVKGGGGESLASEAGARSDEAFEESVQGEASTRIRGGTVPGNVQVGVDVTVPGGKVITGTIQNIIIQSGPPVTDHFGLAENPFNIIGLLIFGEEVDVTAFVGDRYGNPPTPGTSVFFATEAGIIQGGGGKELSDTGSVTATLVSAAPLPRVIESFPGPSYCPNDFDSSNEGTPADYDDPSDGRGTVVAYTKGSEGFIDMDGDGLHIEDGGCIPGKQCPADQPGCSADPAESNGVWDECDDRGSGPRDGICQSNEFNSCDDRDRDGECSATELALPRVCRLGEDIFCILCTSACGTGTNAPTTGYAKLRHKDSTSRDTAKMPDKACVRLLHDRGEPFINSNECVLGDAGYPEKDLDEIFFDINGNGVYDPPNGRYEASNASVWDDIRVVWSTRVGTFSIECSPRTPSGNCGSGCTGTYLTNQEFLIADKCGANFIIHVADQLKNPVVAGCSLTVNFPSGSSTTSGGGTTGCTNPTQTAPNFTVADCVEPDTGLSTGCTAFRFSFTDPDICTSSPTTIDASISVDLTGCKNLGPSGAGKITATINGKYQ
ncbi:MAG: Ig-like domain-containing protein [Nitrospirae bacterium]|nr:Ig-like domain-containing protein [Nitrospirota bacterium]